MAFDEKAELEATLALLYREYRSIVREGLPPNYSVEGQSVSHNERLKNILDAIKQTKELLVAADPYWIEVAVV